MITTDKIIIINCVGSGSVATVVHGEDRILPHSQCSTRITLDYSQPWLTVHTNDHHDYLSVESFVCVCVCVRR